MESVDMKKLETAIIYLQRISDGNNPINNLPADEDSVLNNPNVIRCMFFVKEILEEVKRKSKFIIDELKNADGVKSVTGLGLMLGIETEKDASEVIKICQENGVLPIKAKNKVRLLPPLNITDEELIKAIQVIKKAVKVG